MSICVVADENGYLQATTESTCSQYVLIDALTYDDLQAASLTRLLETLDGYFAFDVSIFGIVNGSLLVTFLTAHYTGRVVKYLGSK